MKLSQIEIAIGLYLSMFVCFILGWVIIYLKNTLTETIRSFNEQSIISAICTVSIL